MSLRQIKYSAHGQVQQMQAELIKLCKLAEKAIDEGNERLANNLTEEVHRLREKIAKRTAEEQSRLSKKDAKKDE